MQLAEEIRHLGYQRIICVPSYFSTHKHRIQRPSPELRLEMAALMARGIAATVDDCEIRRGGVSYTIDTVEQLYRDYEISGKLGVVIGDDLIEGFHLWKEADSLAERADILVAHRLYSEEREFSFRHRYIDNLVLPISSTLIRRLRAEGRAYRFLVPNSIFDYIETHDLYADREA